MAAVARTSAACLTAADELLAAGLTSIALEGRGRAALLDLYLAAGPFFALPEAVRRTAMLPWGCGYVPFGHEHSGDPDEPDQVDFFVYSPRVTHLLRGVAERAARDLLDTMVPAFDVFESIAEGIAAGVASRVGGEQASERLGGGFRRWSLLEVHQARSVDQGQPINGEHEDGVALSLAHANAPGLEVEVDGTFAAATRPAGAMLVMPGSALTMLTGGAIPPLRHRVRAGPPGPPRLSVLFFADLDPARCAPWRVTALNEGVDIGAHVAGNSARFGISGFDGE